MKNINKPGINGKPFKIKLSEEWFSDKDVFFPLYINRLNNKIYSHKNKKKWLIKTLLFLRIIKVIYYSAELY